jgi:cell division septal protein FtsQ
MRRAYRIAGGVTVVAAAMGAVLAAPRVLPAVPGFEVRRVEIVGTRLLDAREVLQTSGIRPGQSVWDDPAAWEAALAEHDAITAARVSRRLPGTLRVQVEEKQPVAYLAEEALTPVTATAERLPVDPSAAPADLPIVRLPEGADSLARRVLGEIERLGRMDSELMAEVSEVRPRGVDGGVLLLRHARADILIPVAAPAERLVELRVVLSEIDGRGGQGDAAQVAEIDLRFADQVVVRLPPSLQTP